MIGLYSDLFPSPIFLSAKKLALHGKRARKNCCLKIHLYELQSLITGEIESCYFEPPDGATLETLDKHWQNY